MVLQWSVAQGRTVASRGRNTTDVSLAFVLDMNASQRVVGFEVRIVIVG